MTTKEFVENTQADLQTPPLEPDNDRSIFDARRELISPNHLKMIAQTSGGFSFREDPTIPPNQTGYTRMDTRTIYYNPLYFYGSKEHGIEPEPHPEGFFYHEAGHHTQDVVTLQNRMLDDLKNIEIPEGYRGDVQTEERFLHSVYRHLDNAIADIWLESYLGRRPYYPIRKGITEFQTRKGPMTAEMAQSITKPEQLVQALLRSRYIPDQNLEGIVDEDVKDSYRKILKSGAMRLLTNASAFENYFASPIDHKRLLDGKFSAYKEVFLPEYLKLVEAELEERKQQKLSGKVQPGQGADGAVPLTKDEEQELVNEIISQLEAAGHECQTLSPGEKEHVQNVFGQIRAQLQNPSRDKGKQARGPKKKMGLEAIEETGRQLENEARDKKQRGLAEALQVRQESIQTWERIKEKYRLEIDSTASVLAEIFLDDRRKRLEYLKREGEIVPGLEYETVAALISGELDPETRMREVRNPEFIEIETEWIFDNSGSMAGENIERSIDLMVIIVEAFKKVKEDLEAENLVMINEDPARIGVTKFTTVPQRVTTLDEPLSDEKELRIIDEISQIGGGTDEAETIDTVYKELTLGKKNVIKLIFVLSDGAGNKAGVEPIIRQIEDDDEVIFLALGLGAQSEQVVDTYVEPLRDKEGGNVFGYSAKDSEEILPFTLDFLKKQVEKKKKELVY